MQDRLLAAAGMAALISLGACATPDRPGQGARVFAALETPSVGTRDADAADDPAIWSGDETTLNGHRVTGFVAGTDKKAGLYIYSPEGAILQFLPEGLLNNVDVATLPGAGGDVILGASDRTPGRNGVALFRFDPVNGGAVVRWGSLPLDLGEPYGFCMRPWRGDLHAFVIGKDGQVRQLVISSGPDGQPRGREVRRFAVGSISEGCAIDADNAALYLNEEAIGVWRYSLDPVSGDARTPVQAVDGERLTADVEGAAILTNRAGSWLIASSQGDSAFAVWRIGSGDPVWVGRFAVHAGPGGDEVTGTDGLDAHGGPFGAFPEGVVIVQDDINDGGQNFKFIDWRDIRRALAF